MAHKSDNLYPPDNFPDFSVSQECASCGMKNNTRNGVKLKLCGGCKKVKYCSRDCAKIDWKKRHKQHCSRQQDETWTQRLAEEQKMINEDFHSRCVYFPSFTPTMAIENLRYTHEQWQSFFNLYLQAANKFKINPQTNMSSAAVVVYLAYYNSLVKDQEFWFALFSEPGLNDTVCEVSIGIIGTLATVQRQKGNFDFTSEILALDAKLFGFYQKMVRKAQNWNAGYCYEELKYKYHMIHFNLNIDLYQEKRQIYREKFESKCVSLFRKLAIYEIDFNLSRKDQNFAFLLLGIKKKKRGKIDRSTLDSATDAEIMIYFRKAAKEMGKPWP
eukprot:Awhi_evm1s1029